MKVFLFQDSHVEILSYLGDWGEGANVCFETFANTSKMNTVLHPIRTQCGHFKHLISVCKNIRSVTGILIPRRRS